LVIFAQERKPETGDWGIGFRLTGIDNISFSANSGAFGTTFLDVRKVLNDRLALRVGFGVDLNSAKSTISKSDTTGGTTTTRVDEAELSQTTLYLAPGLEYHFEGSDKIDGYIGAAIPFGFASDEKDFTSVAVNGSSFSSLNETTITTPGGMIFGLQGFLGFNYFFSEKFAIGAEYGLGLNYSARSGDATRETNQSITTGGTTTTLSSKDTSTIKSSELSVDVNSTAGIGVLVFF